MSPGYTWLAPVPPVSFSTQNTDLISVHRLSFSHSTSLAIRAVPVGKNEPLFINLYLTMCTWSTSLVVSFDYINYIPSVQEL